MKPEPRTIIGRTTAWWGVVLATLSASACDAPLEHEPAERVTYAATGMLADTLVCGASDVMWTGARTDASRCEGPWEYDQYAMRVMEHEDCGTHSCVEDKICTAWARQTVRYQATVHAERDCERRGSEPSITCPPDLGSAQEACNALAARRRTRLNDQPDTRNAHIVSTWVELERGLRATCFMELAYEHWEERVCGCERWRYNECTHADSSLPHITVLTEPGRTLAEVRAAHDPDEVPGQAAVDGLRLVCTTAEERTLTPQDRFARLHENLQDPAITTAGTPLHARFVERLMLVYELFGANLTPEQRAVARALYARHPAVEPACGAHVPAEMPSCHPQVDAALRLCTRLGSEHVAPALVEADYGACLSLLTDLGDALEAGTCERDAPYVEASLAAHRRLHDRMLLRFRDALRAAERAAEAATPAYDPAPIARMLHGIDRWHAAAAAVLTDPDTRHAELALVVNKLWQVAHGYRAVDAAGQTWSSGSLYEAVTQALARADALVEQGNEAGARQEIEDALEATERHALALDQAILRAAYANVADTAQPVLTGAPLLQITADALAPLADRLEALTQYHDLGCALARCATWTTPTHLSRLWTVLAHLDDGSDAPVSLSELLDAVPGELSGWKPVFRDVSTHQARLLAALADAAEAMPVLLRALRDLIARAEARAATYERTGMFQPTIGQTLQTGVHSDQRQRVLDHIDQQRILLEGAHADMENRLVSLVHGLARVRDADATRARLEAAQARVRIELDELGRREASYRRLMADGTAPDEARRSIDQADALFEEIIAAWARAEGGADGATYLRLGDTRVLRLTGADARFDGWDVQTVPQVAAGMRSVNAGQVVSIATEPGTMWAPTCALRDARMIDPDRALEALRDTSIEGQEIERARAFTGPEGYTIAWTGSSYEATSLHAGVETRITAGARAESCAGSPGMTLTGIGARGCLYLDTSVSAAAGASWHNGSEGRTSAQFSSGLYLPNTPFEAPAGSLVVVEMPPGEIDPARLRNVHLVRAPHTTIAVEQAADLYFVVNDISCDEQDRAHVLELTVGTFVTLDDAADALVRRMAHTLALVRARAPEVIARGGLLATERSLIEHDALLDQLGGPDEVQIPVDQYPAPLRDLFYDFLAREMVRLEAMAELAKIEAAQQIQDAEHRAIAVELHQATMSGYMLGLVPRWTVRGMRLAEMREVATLFARDIRHFVVPLLDLWYPEVAAALPNLDVLQRLANVDVNTPVLDLVGWQAELGRALRRRIAEARLPYPSEDDTARKFVALRYPRPAAMDPTCAHIPSARCALQEDSRTFRWATVAETRALWHALGEANAPGSTLRRLTFHVKPEDIYEPHAGSAYLSCRRALPVIRKLGLIVTGVEDSGTPPEQRFVEGIIPEHARLEFVTISGSWPFALVSPVWRALNEVPLVFTWDNYVEAEAAFLRTPQDIRGLSPFTTFELVVPESVVQAWGLRNARSLDLVMELESIRTGAPVAVPVCTSMDVPGEEEARRADAAAGEPAGPAATHTAPQEAER